MGYTLSAAPNNTSNVPLSHGQGGYGMGLGSNGGNGGYVGAGQGHTFGGYTDWSKRQLQGQPNTYKDDQGREWLIRNPNPGAARQKFPNIGQGSGQFENRKGNNYNLLPVRYLDDPHQTFQP